MHRYTFAAAMVAGQSRPQQGGLERLRLGLLTPRYLSAGKGTTIEKDAARTKKLLYLCAYRENKAALFPSRSPPGNGSISLLNLRPRLGENSLELELASVLQWH